MITAEGVSTIAKAQRNGYGVAAGISTLALFLTVAGMRFLKAPSAYDNRIWVILETVIQILSFIAAALLLRNKGISTHAKTVPALLIIIAVVYAILHFQKQPPQSVAWDYLTGANLALWLVIIGIPFVSLV